MIRAIAGLGNPGRRYEGTRHNIGFAIVDDLAREHAARFRRSWRYPAQQTTVPGASGEVTLIKPQTFMNHSGRAVVGLMRKQRLQPEEVLIVVDDLDLELGRLRIRPRGGAGGHNGLTSIIGAVGSENFARLRVGIGPRPSGAEQVDFVLGSWDAAEEKRVNDLRRRAVAALQCSIHDGLNAAMNQFNQ